jgi:serpin B
MNRPLVAVLSALVVVLGACSSASTGEVGLAVANLPRASAAPADAANAAAGINAFGLDLYRRLAGDDGNLVLSPASVALALAQARAGAAGSTADEMDAVLRDIGTDAHAAWLNALDAALNDRSGSFPDANGDTLDVTLRIANAAFAQRDLALRQAYLDALAARFGAGVRLVDYLKATEKARQLINGWVDEQTAHRIPELLARGILTPDTELTLVNAIYLKAPWLHPFEPQSTTDGTFTLAGGATVEVPMMAQSEDLRYAAGDGWQAVELPYVGGSLAMTLLVPGDIAAFERSLTAEGLAAMLAGLETHAVQLTMPRFGIETRALLAERLKAMGMPMAFDPDGADFSGITDQTRLFISEVVHQANIAVDEKGTEAAAATAVVMRDTAMPADPVTVRADRPFLFLLRDLPTGTILFLGRVADPST